MLSVKSANVGVVAAAQGSWGQSARSGALPGQGPTAQLQQRPPPVTAGLSDRAPTLA